MLNPLAARADHRFEEKLDIESLPRSTQPNITPKLDECSQREAAFATPRSKEAKAVMPKLKDLGSYSPTTHSWSWSWLSTQRRPLSPGALDACGLHVTMMNRIWCTVKRACGSVPCRASF